MKLSLLTACGGGCCLGIGTGGGLWGSPAPGGGLRGVPFLRATAAIKKTLLYPELLKNLKPELS